MSRTVKQRDKDELDEFFAGVAEMRAYLDRNLHDPERRRARLCKLASELLKPRDGRVLGEWLTTQLAEALGAQGALLLVKSGSAWRTWHEVGHQPLDEALRHLQELRHKPTHELALAVIDDSLVVPLVGVDGLVGAVFLASPKPLDAASTTLVSAIAETAAVALEQSLMLAAL